MTDVDGVIEKLIRLLGPRVVRSDDELEAARWDRSGLSAVGRPVCIVYAESVDDVQSLMRVAHEARIGVITRGAGSGLAGGSFAGEGEIVLNTTRMNAILEINEDELYAVVEPGVINDHLDATLRQRGFWFAPDPASRDIATVGGNIATNAGGLMCTKYGVTREAVLALDVVLPGGDLIHTGRSTAKGVTGLDLTGLMVGSEGTLGVIVKATVRIKRRVPGQVATLSAYFPTVRDAAAACSAVSAAGLQPAVMELLDSRSLVAIHEHLDLGAPPEGASHVLIQTDGVTAAAEAGDIAAIMTSHAGTVTVARTPAEAERLVTIRRSMHGAIAAQGTTLIEDVCVPRNRLVDMFEAIAGIEHKYGIVIPVVAHAGDGNLHPNFIFPEPEPPPHIWDAASDMFHAALELGGTLSGEHGIGLLKRRWLRDEIGQRQLELQHSIKRVFDPHGIMNPGRVFVSDIPTAQSALEY